MSDLSFPYKWIILVREEDGWQQVSCRETKDVTNRTDQELTDAFIEIACNNTTKRVQLVKVLKEYVPPITAPVV